MNVLPPGELHWIIDCTESLSLSHLVSHLVRLHHRFTSWSKSSWWRPFLSMQPWGFRGLGVHEEIHLFTSNLFQMTLEGVHRVDFNCFLRQAIPSVHHSRREEVQPGITTTVGLHQLPTVTTTSAATISELEVWVQWNSRDASYNHLEQFNQVCSVRSFLQWPTWNKWTFHTLNYFRELLFRQ